ncbi:MAG: LemA family protein [Candidatus Yanofskybacteria bacterium CG10_big_fil_rev_8_21_14_0_10_36_16]|uniref:LemA family protein n=1 Tax=Candidatus Yanofskybacteria bacterium CG10_big_fil_rev_8_21_14_0_10_36_16 TaxID=1975096 RepID=A0A2J0Q740_9BACT|nr:MAG: LemA family protein [Candidatus Yanofskybacteria bacterium CG10_big_fil_rev_8_21_14_0_10_36_16]
MQKIHSVLVVVGTSLVAFGILLFLIIGSTAFMGIGSYNNMVSLSEKVDAQWSNVENVYQRRFDLIPNLVETVRGYASHEADTLTAVTEARAKVGQVNINPSQLTPESLAQFQTAQDGLSSMLSRLMVVVERYPDLKANENFIRLQDELSGTENRIAVERRNYNESARSYNTLKKTFPDVVFVSVARSFFDTDFQDKPYFEAEAGSDRAPKVDFSSSRRGQ